MKKVLFALGVFSLPSSLFSQVGINTTTPAATLDVISKNATGTTTNVDGLLIPRVDRQRAQSMTTISPSTLIYVNNIATGTQTGNAVNINSVGIYMFNGSIWEKLSSQPNIYNANGTLTGNRIVTQNNNTLGFNSSAVNGFSVGSDIFSVNTANRLIGFGTTTPASFMDIVIDNKGATSGNDINVTGYGNSADPGIFLNSAGGTFANPTNLANGTVIGSIQFNPRYGGTMSFGATTIKSIYTGDGTTNSTNLQFLTSSLLRVVIDNNGNMGIGKAIPDFKLDVVGDINASGSVRASGIALTSDSRLKRNVKATDYGLKTIMSLRPVSYEKKSNIRSNEYSRREIGFIAQEVEKIIPSIVTSAPDPDKTLAISYSELIPVLTKAIQEQQSEIEALKLEVKELRAKIKN